MPAYLDRDGERWETAGLAADGEQLLICPNPSDSADWGDPEAPPVPHLMRNVAHNYGPLTAADALPNAA